MVPDNLIVPQIGVGVEFGIHAGVRNFLGIDFKRRIQLDRIDGAPQNSLVHQQLYVLPIRLIQYRYIGCDVKCLVRVMP